MAYQIELRNDTSANWTSNNPTLAVGELGYESDTKKLKIGDGLSNWTTLSYFTGPPGPPGPPGSSGSGGSGTIPNYVVCTTLFLAAPSGGDDAALIAAAVATGNCEIVLAGDTATPFLWQSIPQVPPNAVGVTIRGTGNGARIQMNSAGSQIWAFNRSGDDQTCQNVHVDNLIVDAGGAGGNGHILAGGYPRSGVFQQRVNFYNCSVTRCIGSNVQSGPSATADRRWVCFVSQQSAPGQAVNTFNKIYMDQLYCTGGNYGYQVVGAKTGANALGYNYTHEHITLTNFFHDTLFTYVSPPTSGAGNVQIGSQSIGGSNILVANGIGRRSGDVGIEMDQAQHAVIRDCTFTDSYNYEFFRTNFQAVPEIRTQRIVFERCRAEILNIKPTSGAFGWINNNGLDLGDEVMRDCEVYYTLASPPTGVTGILLYCGSYSGGALISFRSLTIENCTFCAEGWSGTGNVYLRSIAPAPCADGSTPKIIIRNVKTIFTGTESGGALTNEMWHINGTFNWDYDGGELTYNVAGATANTHRYVNFGTVGTSTMNNALTRKFRVRSFSGDTAPRMFLVNNTATLTINGECAFSDNDLTVMPAGGTAFSVAFVSQGAKCRFERNKEPTWPKTRITIGANQFTNFPFVSGTINQYTGGYSGATMISGGTVTNIEVSTDGTNFDSVGTSGPVAIPTKTGTRIRLTFSVSPTVNFQYEP